MPELKGKQNQFLLALLQEPTTEDAIKSMSIARNTAYGYLNDPVFKEALREARREAVMMVTQKLSMAGEEAVSTLREIVHDEDAPATSRVGAARTILEYLYRGFENEEILERLEQLEEVHD